MFIRKKINYTRSVENIFSDVPDGTFREWLPLFPRTGVLDYCLSSLTGLFFKLFFVCQKIVNFGYC
jgi:hypothetical protein